ncbi:hypothetical protein J3459_007392 [Metarhizium acridum]|nr:hypothetical protein J3459_007392 [Metarhizium acridum]
MSAMNRQTRRQKTKQREQGNGPKHLDNRPNEISLASNSLVSCREIHEALLGTLATVKGLPREAQCVVDHSMLLRAKEKYLFDAATNRTVLSDDSWRRFLWDWVADAEMAADDGGMLLGNMDLSYLGVHSIWTNDLGKNSMTRLAPGATSPEPAQWERVIGQFCKKRRLPKFDAVPTKKPFHRQLCLEICSWGDPQRHDPNGVDREADPEYPTAIHTMVASRALFRGDTEQAISILKKASAVHPELLFVSLSLQLLDRGGKSLPEEHLDSRRRGLQNGPLPPCHLRVSSQRETGAHCEPALLPSQTVAIVANVSLAIEEGDIEGIALTGITDKLVDIFARYVQKFHDVQTATLVLSIAYPRYIDDIRCRAWRNAYRAHLQRHRLFFQRTKFEVESTKRSKRDGVPTLKPPSRQIALRCVYCDAETSLSNQGVAPPTSNPTLETRNPLLATSINSGISCPNCGRHLPRCVVCLEVVGGRDQISPRRRSLHEWQDDSLRFVCAANMSFIWIMRGSGLRGMWNVLYPNVGAHVTSGLIQN